jgi:adenylyltransferase/sulfurtransferase
MPVTGVQTCALPIFDGSILIPLGKIEDMKPKNLTTISKSDQIILHCKAGVRSLKAAKALKQMGFEDVKSMAGGIEAWSERIDPSIPKY